MHKRIDSSREITAEQPEYALIMDRRVENNSAAVLIIGCGSYRPINTYIETTSSLYPIYTDPSRQLHSLCRFKSNLSMGVTGDEQRDYMRNAGSAMSRIWGGITYQLGNLQHLNDMGPKSLNGGELILSAGE
ncbi:hypothetical protein NX059_000958 [Plenodomus lindquistii]|nr:hypothetical protein NX059_000958 [Plenodomus lindquistii]